MLYLVGLGIGNEKDLSERINKIIEKCECYFEIYTSKWEGRLPDKVKIITRSDLEEKSAEFVAKAKDKDIALLVIGDPMAATTHSILVQEARKQKIYVKIIHNSSIFSAVGETGLQLYKFGRTASITFDGKLENVKNAVEGNQKLGLHTLLLLDLKEDGTCLEVKDAVKMLIDAGIVEKEKIVVAHISEESVIKYVGADKVGDMETPVVIIIPGKLHFAEKEFLEDLQ